MTQNTQKNQKGIHPETGRSTVEMLTVIVIGTILTLGCVWAIGYALNYVKANAIVSGAQTRIAAVDRRNIQRDINKMDQVLKGFAKSDGQDYIYDIYPTSLHILTELEQSALEIPGPVLQVTGISNGVCRLLKRRTEVPMWINKQTQSAAVCHEEEDNIAWFELTLQPHVHEPDPPNTCAGCVCGCNAGACIEPMTYSVCDGARCVQKGCCPGSCPVDECETNAQCGGGQCTVGGTTYNDGASISECGKCNNGSIEVDTSKVPDCHECDTTNYTLRNLTSSDMDASGRCCVDGVRRYDATLCPDPTQCTVGGKTYNNGDPIGDCGECYNGTISVSKGKDCNICGVLTGYYWAPITSSSKDSEGKCCVNGERKYDAVMCPDPSTQCKVGGKTYNSGAVINMCKECSNGTIEDRTGYTVPTCKVCNADGTLSNATNGSNVTNGQCCVNGTMQASAKYCPKSCTYGGKIYDSESIVGKCGACYNGQIYTDVQQFPVLAGKVWHTVCGGCDSSTGYEDHYKDAGTAIEGEDCKVCDGKGGVIDSQNGDNKKDGKCCVWGVLRESVRFCPKDCTVGGVTYNHGVAIGDCGKCNNGISEVDNTKVTDCHVCDTTTYTLTEVTSSDKDSSGQCCVNGVRKYDATLCPNTQCVVGGVPYNDGDVINTCKQCSNGTIVDWTGYTVPTCKVCNADGTLSNVENGDDRQKIDGVVKCCVNGSFTTSATYCPYCKFGDKTYYAPSPAGDIGETINECGWCTGNKKITEDKSKELGQCEYCDHTDWKYKSLSSLSLQKDTSNLEVKYRKEKSGGSFDSTAYIELKRTYGSWKNTSDRTVEIKINALPYIAGDYYHIMRTGNNKWTISTAIGPENINKTSSIKVNGTSVMRGSDHTFLTSLQGILDFSGNTGDIIVQSPYLFYTIKGPNDSDYNTKSNHQNRLWTWVKGKSWAAKTVEVPPGQTIEFNVYTFCDDCVANLVCQ